MKKTKSYFTIFFLYALFAFPLFYFVYKYWSPALGMIDFYDYYKLYKNLDYKSADSPLNMRLVGSSVVYLMSKLGIIYNTACYMDNYPFDKVVYFNAVFFNYLCVVLTSTLIFKLAKSHGHSVLISFIGGGIYLFGFGTIFFELTPLTDAFSVLLFVFVLKYYLERSLFILVPLLLLILQREYVFLAMGLLSMIDFFKFKLKYYMYVMLMCLLFFGVYLLLRKLVFETPRYAYQTDANQIIEKFFNSGFPIIPFLKQTLMTMNILCIYFGIIIYKYFKRITFDKFAFLKINFLLLQLVALSFVLALGNNTGRYFYILTPLVIYELLKELNYFKLDRNVNS